MDPKHQVHYNSHSATVSHGVHMRIHVNIYMQLANTAHCIAGCNVLMG